MSMNFYERLHKYYEDVAKVLRGEAAVAAIFPNATDIGTSREKVYKEFLKMHAPSKCNVLFGGFLFHENGDESNQIDILINVDTTPRFNFFNQDGTGKTFAPVEGTIGVVSVKSTLDKFQLFDALENIASIPPMASLEGRIPPFAVISDYEDWPYKIVYASNGSAGETIQRHVVEYYQEHSGIPATRRPHVIHVAGKYAIFRVVKGMKAKDLGDNVYPEGAFVLQKTNSDVSAIVWTLNGIQVNAQASSYILYTYTHIINRIHANYGP